MKWEPANNDTNLKSTSAPRFSWTRAEQRRCIGSLINKKNIFIKDFKQNREIEHFMTYVFAREAESFFVTVESSFWHGVSTLCISVCLIGSVSTNRLSKERFKVAGLIKLSSCRITKKKKGPYKLTSKLPLIDPLYGNRFPLVWALKSSWKRTKMVTSDKYG